MGGDQAANTLLDVQVTALKRDGKEVDAVELGELRDRVRASYEEKTDIRYGAARLWVDAIVRPNESRQALISAMEVATLFDGGRQFRTGVFQV
jgi:3-methylcrotonyl-CoA carboxylase beta subunit